MKCGIFTHITQDLGIFSPLRPLVLWTCLLLLGACVANPIPHPQDETSDPATLNTHQQAPEAGHLTDIVVSTSRADCVSAPELPEDASADGDSHTGIDACAPSDIGPDARRSDALSASETN